MFEKIGRLAEAAASNLSMSRRGFLDSVARAAGLAALGLAALMPASRAKANGGYKCCLYTGYYLGCPSLCISASKSCPKQEQVPGGGKCRLAGWTYVSDCTGCG